MTQISPALIAEWRSLQGEGMTSAIGEYTPPEFWQLLDAYEALRECRYCANTGWFYGDPDLKTFCSCQFGKLREELSPPSPAQA